MLCPRFYRDRNVICWGGVHITIIEKNVIVDSLQYNKMEDGCTVPPWQLTDPSVVLGRNPVEHLQCKLTCWVRFSFMVVPQRCRHMVLQGDAGLRWISSNGRHYNPHWKIYPFFMRERSVGALYHGPWLYWLHLAPFPCRVVWGYKFQARFSPQGQSSPKRGPGEGSLLTLPYCLGQIWPILMYESN